jgi:hypothetical protein
MKVTVSPLKTFRNLVLVLLFLLFATVIVRSANHVIEIFWGVEEPLAFLKPFFDVLNNDSSISAWYTSLTLMLCSVLLAIIAAAKRQNNGRYTLHWSVLSIIFLLLSMDEVVRFHETVMGPLGVAIVDFLGFSLEGFLFYTWVVPGAIFALIVLLTYLKFLASLPKKTLLLFLVAGAIFVGGALGVELLDAREAYLLETGAGNADDKTVAVSVWHLVLALSEEGLEMFGVVVFIYALLSYIRSYVTAATVQITIGRE